jgi:hypothetical protein
MADKQRTQAHHKMLKDLGGGLILRRVAAGHMGEVKVSFCGGGFELKHGRLSAVEHWSPTVEEEGNAAFPDLSFLQLLRDCNHRRLVALLIAL